METSRNWIILNIFLPLLPLLLRGVIKLMMHSFSFDVISGSELWFCLGIMALMVGQDLKSTRPLLSNEDKLTELHDRGSTFVMGMIAFIFMCGVTEVLHEVSFIEGPGNQFIQYYKYSTALSYAFTIIFVWYSLQIRRRFGLQSKFL